MKGRLERYEGFSSLWVRSRTVDVWLPAAYDEKPGARFPVLYMHDGQNLFDPSLAYAGTDWGVHTAMSRLHEEEHLLPAIIVGIWNTAERIPEYMPERPMREHASTQVLERFEETYGGAPSSDDYLAFVVREVKSFVDGTFRTKSDRPHTYIMGSSMGGLVSLYAICEYPKVFGAAGCLSTSWTVAGRMILQYLRDRVPEPDSHRMYFDYGVEAQIARYESLQKQANQILRAAGYARDKNWMTERFPGAPHSESAWRERVDIPLRFFLTSG